MLAAGDAMNASFFETDAIGSEFHFLKNSELLRFSREQVDKTAFLHDSNCYWQSICSGENVHRASFLTGEMWCALNFHDLFVTRPCLVGLQCYNILTFFENYDTEYLLQNRACRTS